MGKGGCPAAEAQRCEQWAKHYPSAPEFGTRCVRQTERGRLKRGGSQKTLFSKGAIRLGKVLRFNYGQKGTQRKTQSIEQAHGGRHA